jgi:dienelactone hydrolase
MINQQKIVRAFFQAAKVEGIQSPYDTLHLKIFYPAQISDNYLAQELRNLPVNPEQKPFPVVIFFNGFNCDAQQYQWLAVKLVERGLVVVLFNWITESLPGNIHLTPGIDLEQWKSTNYGNAPSTLALPTLINTLEKLQTEGILAGMLDLQKIILGGHSAGGRLAIENANPQFFPQVTAAFAYGCHTTGLLMLGYEPGTILPLPDTLPLLLMGGTCDGVIANRGSSYGVNLEDGITPVIRTFHEAITGGRKDSYLVIFEGANHFSINDYFDAATASLFLDLPATQPQEKIQLLMSEIIGLFIDIHVRYQPEASLKFEKLLNIANPLLKFWEQK